MLQVKKNNQIHEEVYSLIKSVYGLENYSVEKEEFTKYDDQRTVFTLHKNDLLIGTISLIECRGKDTLPLSSLYSTELQGLLQEYSCIYEVGGFAIDKCKLVSRFGQESLLGTRLLFKAIFDEARKCSADILVVTVNPKHLSFYSLVGFEKFGEQKFYPFVKAPAVPLYLNLKNHATVENFLSRI